MAAWRKEEVDAARHRQENREAKRPKKLSLHTEEYKFVKQHPLELTTSRRNPVWA